MNVLETDDALNYLSTRNILKQYKKAKVYLLSDNFEKVKFKIRKPKIEKKYQFRINKKYRAFGIFDKNNDLVVFEINDHQ